VIGVEFIGRSMLKHQKLLIIDKQSPTYSNKKIEDCSFVITQRALLEIMKVHDLVFVLPKRPQDEDQDTDIISTSSYSDCLITQNSCDLGRFATVCN
jgi:hypothetical protein